MPQASCRSILPTLLAAALFSTLPAAGSAPAAELFAGSFSFSDELGGFRLLSASGAGTSDDPIILVEEIDQAAPITLVVRRHGRMRVPARLGLGAVTIEKIVLNRSLRVWAGFEIELQEIRGRPSVYTDGLSFNQLSAKGPDVSSDSFADNNRIFEPHDRIRFESGFVDPEASARFRITITDPTPDLEFYIVQDPQILSAGLPLSGNRDLAARSR